MRITIAERLRPFSHVPGTYFMLPGSPLRFQLFPALIRIHDLSNSKPRLVKEVPLNVKGPVKNFTIMQDLEKGLINVFGHTQLGYMHYRITANENSRQEFSIQIDKQPAEPISCDSISDNFVPFLPPVTARLSLGSHKAQDWSLISRRCDFTEIFPLWFRLGSLLPRHYTLEYKGTAALFENCRTRIAEKQRESILDTFQAALMAGFEGGLSPRLTDDQYQGFHFPLINVDNHLSPLALLSEGASLIRELFIHEAEQEIHILPALPTEFHCGRFINVSCKSGVLDMEWSKKVIRRMTLLADKDGEICYAFQHDLKQFRLCDSKNPRGQSVMCGTAIPVRAGERYYFDHFEK